MKEKDNNKLTRKQISKVDIFPVPFTLDAIKDNLTISTSKNVEMSKQELINLAFDSYSKGDLHSALGYVHIFIDHGFSDTSVQDTHNEIIHDKSITNKLINIYKRSIDLYPNNSDYYSSLGLLLKDLGKLNEAEGYFRKAIDLNSNIPINHKNLGSILIQTGDLKDAKIYTKKALRLKPHYVTAMNNLGVIFQMIGDLENSEIAFKNAININPDFFDCSNNLGDLLLLRGKLKESIRLSKIINERKSSTYSQKTYAILRIAIINIIIGDFIEASKSINQVNILINKGSLNSIKNLKCKKFLYSYAYFISSLLPNLVEKKVISSYLNIPHIGESHCLSFSNQILYMSSKIFKIKSVLIPGGKAWSYAKKDNNQWKDSLKQQIKNHTYSDKVFISFGEIDCRKDEGILPFHLKNNKNISDICHQTIIGYLDYMEKILSTHYLERYYFGVPAPQSVNQSRDELDIKRIKMIKLFNEILKEEVLSRGSYFLDVYNLTSNKKGENNNIHMCDKIHLSPTCLTTLFENHLFKPTI